MIIIVLFMKSAGEGQPQTLHPDELQHFNTTNVVKSILIADKREILP